MRRSTRRNLERTSNCRRKLGRVNFRKDIWDCYYRQGKNDQKWPRWSARPHLSNRPRKNCGKYSGPNRFKSGKWSCFAQRPRKGVNGRRLVATIGIGLLIENLKADTFELNSVYDCHEMEWTYSGKRLTYKSEFQFSILNIGMQGDFCNNYLPKIEFFKTQSGLFELRKRKTPLGHLLNETQFPFSSSTNF